MNKGFPQLFLSVFLSLSCCWSQEQVSVLTQHNDLSRTGWNSNETILNTGNVNNDQFGILFSRTVDEQIYAQPLVVSNVTINNGTHNVLYVATVYNSLYAFDADSINVSKPYWQISLTPPNSRPVLNYDMSGACGGFYHDFSGYIGIVGTPVIDTATQTLYVVARNLVTIGNLAFQEWLHALDIRTGAEKPNSPVLITAQVNGSGDGSINGVITFNSQTQNQRPGLLLLNGTVYIAFSSHCDWDPYHGWILGYDANTLQQTVVFNDTPEGSEGGIWMGGGAPAADEFGNIYVSTGNGTTVNTGNQTDSINRGESTLKLKPTGSGLAVSSFFTPTNSQILNLNDLDFSVTQFMLIPHSNVAITGCKDGNLYVLNRDTMGGFNNFINQNKQTINLGPSSSLRSSLAYYGGSSGEYVFTWSENSNLFSLLFDSISNSFNLGGTAMGPSGPLGNNGALLSVSSNGQVDSTAILWTSYALTGDANQSVRPGIIRAFQATNISKELWNSTRDPADNPGNYAKFVCPTIANGKVYVATFSNKIVVYGLVTKVNKNPGNPAGTPKVYPNPARDFVIVEKNNDDLTDITMYDISGKLVKAITNANNNTLISIPVSNLAKGAYIIQVRTTANTFRFKLIAGN